jgi:hypothetical protein
VVSSTKWIESLRNAAEIGIDYALNQYNTVAPCPLDPPMNQLAQTTQTTSLPLQYLEASPATAGAPGITVSIKVTEILASSDWAQLQTMSSIYSPQLDPNNTTSHSTGTLSAFQNPASAMPLNVWGGGLRIVESTATNGIYSRTIRVILKAVTNPIRPDLKNPLQPANAYSQNYFSSPFFANTAIDVIPSSSLTIQGYNSGLQQANTFHSVSTPTGSYAAYDLSLQTNQQATIGAAGAGSATIAADVNILSNASGSTPVVSIPNGVIDGRVTTNGIINTNVVSTQNAPQPQSGDTVLANADLVNGSPSRQGLNYAQPEQANTPIASQNQTAPASVPFSTTALAPLSEVSTAITPSTGGTAYESAGLDTTGVATPVVVKNVSNPATFYVDDSGTSTAVNINASQFVSQSSNARNLEIFYQGSDAVNINLGSGGSFTGLIYAPNAPITINGNGTFNGAAVGNSLNVNMSGTMNIYTDLSSTTGTSGNLNGAPGVNLKYMAVPDPSGVGQDAVVQGWQPVTWQEYNSSSSG